MKKRILIVTIMLLLLSSCKGKSQFVVDAKYTPYYNFSIALGETKYFSIVGIKTDEDIFTYEDIWSEKYLVKIKKEKGDKNNEKIWKRKRWI